MQLNRSPINRTVLIIVLAVLFLASLALLTYPEYAFGAELWQLAVNSLLLSIPLGLLYYSIGLLLVAWQQKRQQGQLSSRVANSLYWTPRAASALITLFVALFSLDVFGSGASIWEELLASLMHSIPAIIMGIIVAVAWRRPQIGFVLSLVLAVAFLFLTSLRMRGDLLQALGTLLVFSGPMAVIAILYWADWKWQVPQSAPTPLPAP